MYRVLVEAGLPSLHGILYFIYTHSPRSDKNLLKHLRETKTFKKKRNNLKLLFLNLSKNLLLGKISMAVVNEDLKGLLNGWLFLIYSVLNHQNTMQLEVA